MAFTDTNFVCPATDLRVPLEDRHFVITITDFNHKLYCRDYAGAASSCCYPTCGTAQIATPGTTVSEDNARGTNGRLLDNGGLIEYLLNDHKSDGWAQAIGLDDMLHSVGCPIYTDTDGLRHISCSINSTSRPVFGDCASFDPVFGFKDCPFIWTFSVTAPDDIYKPLCCSAESINVLVPDGGVDPIDGKTWFPKVACMPEWCLQDPSITCAAIFASTCTGPTPCNRHAYLSRNYPIPSSNPAVQKVSILGSAERGIQCNAFYNTVKLQAGERGFFNSESTERAVGNAHAGLIMNEVSAYCADPRYKGYGECACVNAIGASGGQLVNGDENSHLLGVVDPEQIPSMFMQTGPSSFVRVDAYCDPALTPASASWTNLLSYTNASEEIVTFSNACSLSTPWPGGLEYSRSSLNPNRSLFSSTNFGDVVYGFGTESVYELGGLTPSVAMPLHCWLPACVGNSLNGQANNLVFADLFQFTVTCPSICYQYAAGDSVNINNINEGAHIHMGNQFNGCSFNSEKNKRGYPTNPFPYAIQQGCEKLYIQVPSNFSNTFHMSIVNLDLDISSQFSSRTVRVYSNCDYLKFWENGTETLFIDSITLYKYSYGTQIDPTKLDVLKLSVSVNTNGAPDFSTWQNEIGLIDDRGGFQSIPFTLQVLPNVLGAGGTIVPPVACGSGTISANGLLACEVACDCSFSANSLSANCQTGVYTHNEDRFFTVTSLIEEDYGAPFLGKKRVSQSLVDTERTQTTYESMQRLGVLHRLLSAHSALYGQPFHN